MFCGQPLLPVAYRGDSGKDKKLENANKQTVSPNIVKKQGLVNQQKKQAFYNSENILLLVIVEY